MFKVYSHVKPGEVTDVQGTPMILNLCFVCQTILPEPISQQKRVCDRAKTAKGTRQAMLS